MDAVSLSGLVDAKCLEKKFEILLFGAIIPQYIVCNKLLVKQVITPDGEIGSDDREPTRNEFCKESKTNFAIVFCRHSC